MNIPTSLLFAAAPVVSTGMAAPALYTPQLLSTGYLMQVVGSLAIVFGAVVLMAIVVKRMNRSPIGQSHLSVMLHQRGHAEGRTDQRGATDFGRRGAGNVRTLQFLTSRWRPRLLMRPSLLTSAPCSRCSVGEYW